MRVIDPANVYLNDRAPRRQGPMYRGGAIFGPGVADGSRQATEREIEELRQRSERRTDNAGTRPAKAVDRAALARAAQDLISSGEARIDEGALAPLHARVVDFWRGDGVLEIDAPTSGSRTRIPRKLESEHEGLLVHYLATHAGSS